jgi:hypothetical protein
MTGGLLNLISEGKESVILIGQPTKTFFKKTYLSHTNFGQQKFRINFEGETSINYNSNTIYKFKIPRYGDLLNQLYFSFTLPNIWSPILSFGGVPAMFCSACRTQISQKLDTTFPSSKPATYSTFVNEASYNCYACGCDCTTQFAFTNIFIDSGGNVNYREQTPTVGGMKWVNRVIPFEFKWIENIGAQIIRSVKVYSNNTLIQDFTGQYLLNMVHRDFTHDQKKIFDRMIGNTADLNDPKNYKNRNGNYPNAAYFGSMYEKMRYGLEPSIRGKKLYVPINLWSTINNKTPIPLIGMQYSELRVEIDIRPVNEWWVVKNIVNRFSLAIQNAREILEANGLPPSDISIYEDPNQLTTKPISITTGVEPVGPVPDISNCYDTILDPTKGAIDTDSTVTLFAAIPQEYTSPRPNEFSIYNLKYFLKAPPPKVIIDRDFDPSGAKIPETGAIPFPVNINKTIQRYYDEVLEPWFADIHLIGNYTFLTDDERNNYAQNCQSYLIREVHEQDIYDLLGGDNYVPIQTQGLVISWMWYFQRSDVNLRNEWSNYNNIPYRTEYNQGAENINGIANSECRVQVPLKGLLSEIVWQPPFNPQNIREILVDWGLFFNSTVREFELDNGIVSWIDVYSRSEGAGLEGVYYYNFCLNSSPFLYQPSGAVNLSAFTTINWKFKLKSSAVKIEPPSFIKLFWEQEQIVASVNCDPLTNNSEEPITTRIKKTELYLWSFTLHIMEERYNILTIKNGVASLAFARTI